MTATHHALFMVWSLSGGDLNEGILEEVLTISLVHYKQRVTNHILQVQSIQDLE